MKRIVHFYLDDFFVTAERARRPELAHQAIVVGGRADSVGQVAAASAEARAAGVRAGLPLREAAARCPTAHFLPGDLERYHEVADAADLALRRVFSRVEWSSLDEAYVDAAFLRSACGLVAATEAVQSALHQELGLRAACGIGSSKITASMAARLVRPAGLLYVLPGYDRQFLAPLPLELLPGLPASLRDSLASRGVDTLGALADLSDAAACVCGSHVDPWRRLAMGDDDRPVVGTPVPRALFAETALEGAFAAADDLAARLRELTCDVASQLTTRGLLARQVTVRVTDVTDAVRWSRVNLTTATSSAEALVTSAVTALSQALRWPRSATALSVRLSSLRICDRQPSLFAADDVGPRGLARAGVSRRSRNLERVLLVARDRPLTRRAS